MADQNYPEIVNVGFNPTLVDMNSCCFSSKSIYDLHFLSYYDLPFDVINVFAIPEVLFLYIEP